MSHDYFHKYLKYKNKYLSYKNSSVQSGGFNIINPNEDLYYLEKNGVYYVMERIDNRPRLEYWKEFIKKEESGYADYRRKYLKNMKKYENVKGLLHFHTRDQSLSGALGSFKDVVTYDNTHNELWIAYVKRVLSDKEKTELAEYITILPSNTKMEYDEDLYDPTIEMFVSVVTTEEAPMVTHMGITRSFNYLFRAMDKVKLLHTGISLDLHSFAALIMTKKYKNKLYMMTTPVPMMRDIFLKYFPKGFIGDSFSKITDIMTNLQTSLELKYLNEHVPEIQKIILKWYPDVVIKNSEEAMKFIENLKKQGYKTKMVANALRGDIMYLIRNEKSIITKNVIDQMMNMHFQKSFVLEDNAMKKLIEREHISPGDIEIYKQINELSANLPITINDSPIRVVGRDDGSTNSANYDYLIEIYDKTRTNVVFSHDKINDILFVYGKEVLGENKLKYEWFTEHLDSMNKFFTIDLDILASYILPKQNVLKEEIKGDIKKEDEINKNNVIDCTNIIKENDMLKNKLEAIKDIINKQNY